VEEDMAMDRADQSPPEGAGEAQKSTGMNATDAGRDIDGTELEAIDETEFEDLAAFRLKPEAIEGESQAFLMRYAAYLHRQGLSFD
jgi:hypothetical protein